MGVELEAFQPAETLAPGRQRPFAALYERNYALLLFGNGLSHAGDMMEHVARGWLVLELTGSPLALGVVAFASGLPRLMLGLVAGVLADRLDRRGLLFLCSIVSMLASVVYATLVLLGAASVWHVVGIVLVMSVFSTLNLVTRQALIPDVVSRANLGSAVALHSTVRGTTQILAQSAAGVLIAAIGVAGVLYVNSVSFLAMLVALLLMRIPLAPAPAERLGFREDLERGLRYVWRRQDLFTVILLTMLPVLLVMPYRTLMPIFARDILQVGAAGYGVLMAAPGLGGLVAAAALSLAPGRRQGRVLAGGLLLLSAGVAAFALSPSFIPALAALVLVGMAFNAYRIATSTLLQTLTPRQMMGRVMGLYHMDRGLQPLGSLALGWLAALAGVPLAVALAGAACGVLATVALMVRPAVRRL